MADSSAIRTGCAPLGDEIRHPGQSRATRVRLVVFDFDGTLADSYAWLIGALNRLAPRYGFRAVAPAEEPVLRQLGASEILRRLRLPVWKRPSVARALRRLMREEIDGIRLFPGIGALLTALNSHDRPLAIASSNAYENIARVLGPESLSAFAHFECGIGLTGKAARLRALRRRFQLGVGELLYIGDEVRDLHAARGAGAAAGAVSWGYNHPDALLALKPDYLFRTPEEIRASLIDG